MPLVSFTCPDGINRRIATCLERCPRPQGRCLSLPTLVSIGSPRTWRGKPSTTQLLNPTRLEYLMITKDYAIDPFEQAFALLGTRHHGRLEQVAKKIEGLKSELKLDGEVSGILDLLEPLDGDKYRLIDYKTFGSYAVAKQLNLKENSEYDRHKLELQMNNYRLMAQGMGFDVAELKCQITVRDGGTYSAKQNGIDKKLYLLDVKILEDDYVQSYFTDKAMKLITALDKNEMPELCDYQERWGGRRCKGYCNVSDYCPEGRAVNKLPPTKDLL